MHQKHHQSRVLQWCQIPANLLGRGCLIPSYHFKRLSLNLDASQTSRTKSCKATLATNNLVSVSEHTAETAVRVQKMRAELPLLRQRYHRPLLGHKASPGKGQDPRLSEPFLPFHNVWAKKGRIDGKHGNTFTHKCGSGANSKNCVTLLPGLSIWGWPRKFLMPRFTHWVGYPPAPQQRRAWSPAVLLPSPVPP